MEVISQKNLDRLIDMGFEITYKVDNFIKLFNTIQHMGELRDINIFNIFHFIITTTINIIFLTFNIA